MCVAEQVSGSMSHSLCRTHVWHPYIRRGRAGADTMFVPTLSLLA
jgi:hypothetical protein